MRIRLDGQGKMQAIYMGWLIDLAISPYYISEYLYTTVIF